MTNNSVFWGVSLALLGIWQLRKCKAVIINEKNIDFSMLANVLISIYGIVTAILDLSDEMCAVIFGIIYFRHTYVYNKRNKIHELNTDWANQKKGYVLAFAAVWYGVIKLMVKTCQ